MGKKIEIDSDELKAVIRKIASDYTFYDWSIATKVVDLILKENKFTKFEVTTDDL